MVLIDGFGVASSRASSGGESRVIRCGYGADELYSRFAQKSLGQWKDLGRRVNSALFHQTGVLWLARKADRHMTATAEVLARLAIPHEKLDQAELVKRFPQFFFGDVDWAIYEPDSGALMARRAVQMLVQEMVETGLDLVLEPVGSPALMAVWTPSKRQAGERSAPEHLYSPAVRGCPKYSRRSWTGVFFRRVRRSSSSVRPSASSGSPCPRCLAGWTRATCMVFRTWRIAD